MERARLTPRAYSRVTLLALVALAFIVVTGAAVRLTGSGLGCPDWPTCDQGRLVAPLEYHAMVEFVNRTVTGIVSVAVILAVLGSLVRSPRRRDLTWLSVGLVAGVLGQIVLGGLVVLFHLAPPLVMGHFVVSMLLLLDATLLHHRAGLPDSNDVLCGLLARNGPITRTEREAAPRDSGFDSGRWVLLGAAALAIFLGTVVTGAGPHAGSHDGDLVERLPFEISAVARIHSVSVIAFAALAAYLTWHLARSRAPAGVLRKAELLLAVLVAQAAVGYAEYFTGVPALLVAVHVAGAVAVWITTLRLVLAMPNTMPPNNMPPNKVPAA